MATIELRTRDVQVGGVNVGKHHPQHGYFIITFDNGVQNIVRAGPSNNSMATGDLQVMMGLYSDQLVGPAKSDYITDPNQFRSAIIFVGSEYEVRGYVTKIWQYGVQINTHSVDYKLPGGDIVNNSNSFIYKALTYAGLKFAHPTYPDGTKVSMPGLEGEIGYTAVDKVINSISKANEYSKNLAEMNNLQAQFDSYSSSDSSHSDFGCTSMSDYSYGSPDSFSGSMDSFSGGSWDSGFSWSGDWH